MGVLDDTTRKVLRVLFNRKGNEWFRIEVEEIERYAMRTEKQVKASINELVRQAYVEWNKSDRLMRVLKSTEDAKQQPAKHWHNYD
jgi:hypothetical protein